MNKTSLKLEKLFLTYINEIGETSGGFINFVNPDIIEECDPNKIRRELQKAVNILKNRLEDVKFQLYEYEKGKTRFKLKETLVTLRKVKRSRKQGIYRIKRRLGVHDNYE